MTKGLLAMEKFNITQNQAAGVNHYLSKISKKLTADRPIVSCERGKIRLSADS